MADKIDASLKYELDTYKEQANANNTFNAKEALKQRNFEERLSNSAHQREVKDLIAAGLNPVLSANAGASTPVGVSAQADTSANQAMATSFSSKRQAETAIKTAQIQANAQMAAAAAAAGAAMYAARMQNEASHYATDVGKATQIKQSVINAFSNIHTAQISKGSSIWGLLDKYAFAPLSWLMPAGNLNTAGNVVRNAGSALNYVHNYNGSLNDLFKGMNRHFGTGQVSSRLLY